MDMGRQEHLQWCKDRALEYVDQGDLHGAFASMVSDLNKNQETAGHSAINLGMQMLMDGHLETVDKMIDLIEGFN